MQTSKRLSEIQIEPSGLFAQSDIQSDDERVHVKPETDDCIGRPIVEIELRYLPPYTASINTEHSSEAPVDGNAKLHAADSRSLVEKAVLRKAAQRVVATNRKENLDGEIVTNEPLHTEPHS